MTTETTAPVSDPNPDNVEDTHQSVLLTTDPAPVPSAAVPPVPAVAPDGGVEFEPTGDVGLDMALAFIGKQGITADHPALKAAEQGDFSILKATLAQKGAAGWEQFVALGEAAYARTTAENTKKAEASREAVYKEAGGKDEWLAIQTWASTNATPEEKAQINGLLNQGGLAAKSAVRYLVDVYGRANNVTVEPRDAQGQAVRGGLPNAANAPLSPREYTEAVRQLNVKLHGRIDGSPEYAKLQARRAAHRG